jgi:peptidoglycan/LPS O-acetylase OafA/YrhL
MTETQRRTGSFDTVRLIAALMVFHSHSYSIAGGRDPWLPGNTVGGSAVMIFFTVSGYWVSRSALERSALAFATARALRIVPGLLVCLLVTIGLCALATTLPAADYFSRPDTWSFLRNALPYWLPMAHVLPGVFRDGAYHNVNGSLWTLRYEVFCYLVCACAAMFGPRGIRFASAGFAVFALATLFRPHTGGFHLTDYLEYHWVALFGLAFFFGASLSRVTDRQLAIVVGLAALWMALGYGDPALAQVISIFLYGGAAVWVGRNLQLDALVTRGRDISYGLYIYAYPCEQLVVRAIAPTGPLSHLAYYLLALTASLALALLSWTLVEKPALRAKRPVAEALERLAGRLLRGPGRPSSGLIRKEDVVR